VPDVTEYRRHDPARKMLKAIAGEYASDRTVRERDRLEVTLENSPGTLERSESEHPDRSVEPDCGGAELAEESAGAATEVDDQPVADQLSETKGSVGVDLTRGRVVLGRFVVISIVRLSTPGS
jgi:hypothetical protein